VAVTGVIMMLAKTPGFEGEGALPAPQANAMAALIEPLMTGQPAPWLLYMAGVFMALILEWTGLPALAFALGMYLPLSVNTPVLAGGLIAHFVAQGGSREASGKRRERGTLMASGFVAGGAIMGVIASTIRFVGAEVSGDDKWSVPHAIGTYHWEENPASAVVTLLCFCLLGWYLYRGARSAAKD
jgi:uncharacterized oligopeptide transporter (OPT) family protein